MKRFLPLLLLAACTISTEPLDAPRFATTTASAILLIAGDIAWCGIGGDEKTAAVLDSLVNVYPDAIVVPNGDLVYPDGSAANFTDCYGPSWGRHKARSRPTPGNHEYTPSATAEFYFDYFNGVGVTDGIAGPRGKGYYSYDPHPSWHVVALNTNSKYVSTKANTPQGDWLKADLAAHPTSCLLALFHHPRFASQAKIVPLSGYTLYPWQQMLAAKGDLIVNGSFHSYERFGPQREDGTADPNGVRQFIAGTGGSSGASTPATIWPNSEVWGNARGVLMLELGEGYYNWTFVPATGYTFTDAGTAPCHNADSLPHVEEPPPPPPVSAISLTLIGEKRTDGKLYMTLDWTGATGVNVDVYRNGVLLLATANDGHYVNSKTYTGATTLAYKVCQTGSAVCSNEAGVTFN